jgi:alkylated DNA repair dioxygenase AlkB
MNYQQLELFNKKLTVETPAIEQGDVKFYPNFFTREISDFFYHKLYQEVKWEQKYITLYGKTHLIPRLTAWYGDEGKIYTYSNITMYPQPWTDSLLTIKNTLKSVTEAEFNSVLLNLYRHGQDSMGWHSDNEKELGNNPVIASVNFGETRRFMLKPRDKNNHTKIELNLSHGSVLIMAGETQKYWLHQIPKTTRKLEPRINLTFRLINYRKD